MRNKQEFESTSGNVTLILNGDALRGEWQVATIVGTQQAVIFSIGDTIQVINFLSPHLADDWTVTEIDETGFEWCDPNTGELHWHPWRKALTVSNVLTRTLHNPARDRELFVVPAGEVTF